MRERVPVPCPVPVRARIRGPTGDPLPQSQVRLPGGRPRHPRWPRFARRGSHRTGKSPPKGRDWRPPLPGNRASHWSPGGARRPPAAGRRADSRGRVRESVAPPPGGEGHGGRQAAWAPSAWAPGEVPRRGRRLRGTPEEAVDRVLPAPPADRLTFKRKGKTVTETSPTALAQRKAQREIEEFRRFQQLTRALLEVNEKICRLRPVPETPASGQEKKRPKPFRKKSPAK